MDNIDSLCHILAKSPSRNAPRMSLPNQPGEFTSSSAPTTASPALAIPLVHSRSAPVFEYQAVNVPGSSSKSLIGALGSSSESSEAPVSPISPLKKSFGTFFRSFRGRSPFDADEDEFGGDEDEFDRGRKYSTATLATNASPPTQPPHWGSSAVVMTANSLGPATDASSRILKGRNFFRSFRGRSPFDADDDEFDGGHQYSTTTLKKSDPPKTPTLKAIKRRSLSPYPLSPPKLSNTSPSPSPPKLRNEISYKSHRGRSPFDGDGDEFDLGRDYTIAILKSSPAIAVSSASANPKKTHARRISWADQIKPVSSDAASKQTEHGSKDDAESANTGSTLSLTSTFDSRSPSPRPAPTSQGANLLNNINSHKTVRKSEGKLMSATLAAAREMSPYKGSMWDPEDDEWLEVDA
jgi:hypothetical protein